MKCLILGGTRYIGKRLVEILAARGDEVFVLSRGQTQVEFPDGVKRIQADRNNAVELEQALIGKPWDVVYDQIGFTPQNALDLLQVIQAKRLIFTSSQSVYDYGSNIPESAIDPYTIKLPENLNVGVDYQVGKRYTEAVYLQQGTFPIATVRFPIVLGEDDHTRRLHFHVRRIKNGEGIYFPSPKSKISFISSEDAALFLAWLSTSALTGPVNACSPEPIGIDEIVQLIEKSVGKKAIFDDKPAAANESPFGIGADWWMNTEKAANAAFSFKKLSDWFPSLIKQISETI